jgi:hypothetical protein
MKSKWCVSKTRHTLLVYLSNTFHRLHFNVQHTLRLHRRLREIAGFHVATLPGLEHKACCAIGFWVNRAWQVLHDEAYV